ncbi:MAG: tetratricopeptide repeat protein [Nitrospirae bacterium]|nr:tetratricopeptide repeat protein [Nitrospirota bacterium]
MDSACKRGLTVFYICLVNLFLSACAPVPKVIVLHDPLSAEEHLSLGLGYELNGEYEEAIGEYDKALRKSEGDDRPFYYMANAYYKKGEYDLAEEYYRQALEISPGNGDIYNNLAWAYMATERLDEARGEIERALSIRRDPYYLDTLANIYGRMGKHEEAVAVIQEAIGITESEQVDLLFSEYRLLGDLYELMGKEDLAAGSWEKAEAYRRKHP